MRSQNPAQVAIYCEGIVDIGQTDRLCKLKRCLEQHELYFVPTTMASGLQTGMDQHCHVKLHQIRGKRLTRLSELLLRKEVRPSPGRFSAIQLVMIIRHTLLKYDDGMLRMD